MPLQCRSAHAANSQQSLDQGAPQGALVQFMLVQWNGTGDFF